MSDPTYPQPPADRSVKVPHLVFGLLFLGVAGTVTIEFIQYAALPDRSATLSDLVANTLGAVIGVDLDYGAIGANESMMMVTASSTAVTVD